jgi:hypothetical protein
VGYGIKLADADRARYSCPEVLDCNLSTLMLSEARDLQQVTGYSPDELLDLVSGKPEVDPDGQPLMHEDGRTQRRKRDWMATNPPLVWLGLRRAGIVVQYPELDFQVLQATLVATPEAEPREPGKDPSTPEPEPGTSTG